MAFLLGCWRQQPMSLHPQLLHFSTSQYNATSPLGNGKNLMLCLFLNESLMFQHQLTSGQFHCSRSWVRCLRNTSTGWSLIISHNTLHYQTHNGVFSLENQLFRHSWSDSVPHIPLITKLQQLNLEPNIVSWVRNYLSDRSQGVVIDGAASEYLPDIWCPARVSSRSTLIFDLHQWPNLPWHLWGL